MKYAILLLLILQMGCSPTRHWKAVATDTKVTPEKKAIIAPKVAVMFPSQTKYLPGEVITATDTVVDYDQVFQMAEIIDSLLMITVKDSTNRDSISNLIRAILKRNAPLKIYQTDLRVDTSFIPDPATAALLYSTQQSMAICEETNAKILTGNDQLTTENKTLKKSKNKWLWWLIALGVLNVAFVAYKVFKR